MYDFFYYTGTTRNEKYNSQVVKRLLEGLPKSKNYRLFFYNWFCTLDLCIMLKRMGLLSTTTVRVDRMKSLPSGNETNNMGQGTRRYKSDLNSGLVIVRWYDNKYLSVIFTYANPEQCLPVQRCDQVSKNYISTNCPNVINYYNKSMGDVDLAYMLI